LDEEYEKHLDEDPDKTRTVVEKEYDEEEIEEYERNLAAYDMKVGKSSAEAEPDEEDSDNVEHIETDDEDDNEEDVIELGDEDSEEENGGDDIIDEELAKARARDIEDEENEEELGEEEDEGEEDDDEVRARKSSGDLASLLDSASDPEDCDTNGKIVRVDYST
jgi:hypothetical protein